ncbi:deoxyribodipyrimidine photo-lyase [Epibacterium ulvae]|uniref:Deoxyribodipyrimidine photo-lyase n=1 Tax=Epibacterium ulvae TaxID=1156985 RepID=A0A1G5QA45_9RHOB|nr:deoxyribodipyrimidine photo-lyase [Epibacterium ulvae]SCZ58532.1 deoxyribodipyrimidine photo-lyase [Epibacterium ulvae]
MTSSAPPIIWWIRRDLRLADNTVLEAIAAKGRAVVPVYVFDEHERALGAAAKWRLGQGLHALQQRLQGLGLGLTLTTGDALQAFQKLCAETGADAVYWSRLYDPEAIERDTKVKAGLKAQGVEARSYAGRMLFEPWTVETKTGGAFKVFTPFWKAVRGREVASLTDAPRSLRGLDHWPRSLTFEDLDFSSPMNRGAAVLARYCEVGEEVALRKLSDFCDQSLASYNESRNILAAQATSDLSDHLAWGEVSPLRLWSVGQAGLARGLAGAEQFCKEVIWREFATHLVYHTPQMISQNWRPDWDAFSWQDGQGDDVLRWQQGQTGFDLIDAAMRELYTTGKMHNRARMVVASFLCKHMMINWKIGADWFRDCLVDWDPASNAMGWQWVAGSGPDAAPFFRIFNPETQRKTYDGSGNYCRRWLAEGQEAPPQTALDFFEAIPRRWCLSAQQQRCQTMLDLAAGRARALEAYQALRQNS